LWRLLANAPIFGGSIMMVTPLLAVLMLRELRFAVLTRADAIGLMIIVGSLTLLMFSAGAFNPIFGAFRMDRTSDDYMARVATFWSFTAKWSQPIFAAAGGVITTTVGLRPAIGCAAVLLLASATLLLWHPAHEEFPTA
jgi:hypothetical protein